MAQLQLQPVTTGKKNRARKAPLRIDMTPMVDLGFLLITFFIFTTTMTEPYETSLVLPKDSTNKNDSINISESNALTILLKGNDSVYYSRQMGKSFSIEWGTPYKLSCKYRPW